MSNLEKTHFLEAKREKTKKKKQKQMNRIYFDFDKTTNFRINFLHELSRALSDSVNEKMQS